MANTLIHQVLPVETLSTWRHIVEDARANGIDVNFDQPFAFAADADGIHWGSAIPFCEPGARDIALICVGEARDYLMNFMEEFSDRDRSWLFFCETAADMTLILRAVEGLRSLEVTGKTH
jgi:hypothetical protein